MSSIWQRHCNIDRKTKNSKRYQNQFFLEDGPLWVLKRIMNNGQKLNTGNLGEDIAENYLKKKGYKIISRNYRNKYGEIDLVVRDKNSLVFVEVRTRRNERFGSPEESVNSKKKRKMFKNTRAYVAFHNFKGKYRIDVICVVLSRDRKIKRINHYRNIEAN